MATETTNYKLEKPTQDEFYDVEVFNRNADKLDAAIAEAAASGGVSEETAAKLDEILNALKTMTISHKKMKGGKITAAETVTFNFKEIDTIANDADTDVNITFKNESGGEAGTFTLKSGESINDLHFAGSGFSVAGTGVNVRYLLLG